MQEDEQKSEILKQSNKWSAQKHIGILILIISTVLYEWRAGTAMLTTFIMAGMCGLVFTLIAWLFTKKRDILLLVFAIFYALLLLIAYSGREVKDPLIQQQETEEKLKIINAVLDANNKQSTTSYSGDLYVSSLDDFKINFPFKPTEATTTISTGSYTYQVNSYQAMDPSATSDKFYSYSVIVDDFKRLMSADAGGYDFLKKQLDIYSIGFNGEIIDSINSVWGQYKSVDYKILREFKNVPVYTEGKFIFVPEKGRLFVISLSCPENLKKECSNKFNEFIESFEL